MAPLKNPRHERFALELAKGRSAVDAYEAAGYHRDTGNAAVLRQNEAVCERVAELAADAVAKAGITVERVIAELAKIAFVDISEVVEWGTLHRDDDEEEFGEGSSDFLRVKDSAEIGEDAMAAIAGIAHGSGGLTVKFHDKRRALATLARIVGLFDRRDEKDGNVTVNLVPYSDLNEPKPN